MRAIEKIIDWPLDKVLGVGLVLTLLVSLFLGYDSIQGNIISGLIGYMSKTVVTEVQERKVENENHQRKSKKRC